MDQEADTCVDTVVMIDLVCPECHAVQQAAAIPAMLPICTCCKRSRMMQKDYKPFDWYSKKK